MLFDQFYRKRNSIYPNELAACIKNILSDVSRKNVNRKLDKMFLACPAPHGNCRKLKCPFTCGGEGHPCCFMDRELREMLYHGQVKDNDTLAKVLLVLTRYLAKWEAVSRYRKKKLSGRKEKRWICLENPQKR